MTRDDIIRMAREAGLQEVVEKTDHHTIVKMMDVPALERFAALVRDHLLSTDIHSCHANCERFACVQTRRAVEAEREACAKAIDDLSLAHPGRADLTALQCAAAIRARGEKK